jgi:hypothetical protein
MKGFWTQANEESNEACYTLPAGFSLLVKSTLVEKTL